MSTSRTALCALLLSGCVGGGTEFESSDDPSSVERAPFLRLSGEKLRGACAPYPDAQTGWREGDVVQNMDFEGNDVDGRWSMEEFWCMGRRPEGATVLVLDIGTRICGIDVTQAWPELQTWQDTYGDRGLVPVGVEIGEVAAEQTWFEQQPGVTHPWMADPVFSLGQFFEGPSIGTPAYVFILLEDMTVFDTQQGYSGIQEETFEPYLRPE